jgi:uncharacterized membrane protein (GlpM family)
MREGALPVLVSVLVVVRVAVVQGRARYLAAIIAAMPLTAPLAIWIVFSANGGDQRQVSDFALSMVVALRATFVFVVACWFGLRQEVLWPNRFLASAVGHAGLEHGGKR